MNIASNLYHDVKNDKYYAILENGEVEEVAKIENQKDVYIKLSYLIRYATAKQMAILLFFDIKADNSVVHINIRRIIEIIE